ncbi:MAG TPA: hypothetical protein VHF69_13710, partial [Candidatus Synoicihabitans sp.]|nr:hypothetical protein [Candidatus Synoicihabitans sp.]
DNWLSAAVALRNWLTLHIVVLSFLFMLLGLAWIVRADLTALSWTQSAWGQIEAIFWNYSLGNLWGSPWFVLPLIPFCAVMLPTGVTYWFTQSYALMGAARRTLGLFRRSIRGMSTPQFIAHAQNVLTRGFMLGLVPTIILLVFALVDSVGQTIYLRWSTTGFDFPASWAALTSLGAGLFAFGSKIALYLERFTGVAKFRIPFNIVALALALAWLALIILALAVIAAGLAWRGGPVWDGVEFHGVSGGWALLVAVSICFAVSWICSRSFGFVNLSSMQQVYAARLARAYLGATNPVRQEHGNHSMTDLIAGDDISYDHYYPHRHGGPLHLINVTINETLSGKTQIARRDRKGMIFAISPCGLSAGRSSHALWATSSLTTAPFARFHALWERRRRTITSVVATSDKDHFDTFGSSTPNTLRQVETLSVGRWVAISGAAFTTGTGATTSFGLSLLLGLANVRLGYWWDSGSCQCPPAAASPHRTNFLDLVSRVVNCVLPVQSCLVNEFSARFHGPARRHWYLSDGGHFENTGCYELIRRRVPLIICSDAGQDSAYRFDDVANLVRKARLDFSAEIQFLRRTADRTHEEPGLQFPLPSLEDVVHP